MYRSGFRAFRVAFFYKLFVVTSVSHLTQLMLSSETTAGARRLRTLTSRLRRRYTHSLRASKIDENLRSSCMRLRHVPPQIPKRFESRSEP